MKLAVEEPESAVLHAYVDAGTFELTSSALAVVEVARGVRVADLETSSQSTAGVLDRLLLIDVDREILRLAVSYTSARVRSLDAIHLASAMRADARQMLVYDRRLAEAAAAAGLEVLSPGA